MRMYIYLMIKMESERGRLIKVDRKCPRKEEKRRKGKDVDWKQ